MWSREDSESAASQTKQGVESSRDTDNPYNVEDSSPLYPAKSASEFYRARPVRNRRIHILGVGNVGTFIAHALRGIPNPPPVTLIFNHEGKLRLWEKSNKTLSLVTDGTIEARDGYDVELAIPRRRYHGKEMGEEDNTKELENESASEPPKPQTLEGESNEPIHSLIVCSKTPYVLQALSAVKHRLHKHSVVLFLQNGMGTVEEVNREIFQDPATRPYYMIGVNSHGMHASKEHQFTTVHAGFGTISLGILPHERYRKSAPYAPLPKFHGSQEGPVKQGSEQHAARAEEGLESTPPPTSTSFNWTPHERYLLRTLLRTPILSAASFSPPDLLQMQLEKLAVNCIINPLTVMVDARNGSILYNYSLTRVIRLLLSEISLVIRSLPELQYIPNVEQRFDPGRLETIVVGVAQKTRNNISSMLADARAGRLTEIDYINGWIVRKGEEQGIRCVMNYMMLHLVKGKKKIIEMELQEATPLVTPGGGGVEIKMDESVRPVE